MGLGISEILPFAVAVAIVPIPIIGVILVLFSRRARVNGPLFALGWVTGLTVAFVVVFALTDAGDDGTESSPSDTVSWGRLLLGVALLALALRTWRRRPAAGEATSLPGWLAGVDELAPVRAAGLGVLLAAANPKNLLLIAGAATGLAQIGLSSGDAVAALIVFVVVGSLTVAGPVVYFFVGGDGAHARLEELRAWLAANNAAVMVVLLLVFGVLLIAKALEPLSA